MNYLYYGDNLDILRRYIKDESIDLIYLDPPFKSNQDYNVLSKERNGTKSAEERNEENFLEFIDEEDIIRIYQERLDWLWGWNG